MTKTMYWLQIKAPAGNWVDNTGSTNMDQLKRHGRFLRKVRRETVRIVQRADRVLWTPVRHV